MINTQEQIRQKVKKLIPKQEDVAKACNIEPTYFSRWLNGNCNLGAEKIDRIILWIQDKD